MRNLHIATAPPDCPELGALDPALAVLPVEELERRLTYMGPVPPFAVRDQIAGMRAAANAYRPEKRRCMYKVMLVSAVASAAGMVKSTPGLWGLQRKSDDIAALFRAAALRRPLDAAQRDDLLAQIDQHFLPSLRAESDADREYWRRLYYGILLTEEASDETLARLGAARPRDRLNLQPRPAPPAP